MTPDSDPPTFPALSTAENTLALPPGHRIHEYAIQNTLGGGGFGITYLAHDVNLDLPVAIKEYLPSDLAGRGQDHSVNPLGAKNQALFGQGLERFLDEARTLATFRHPNIIRVLRYFKANGTAYIVMEYESGESLKQWLPRHTPIDRDGLLKLVHPLLDGLAMVHQAGFLHRDIKPDNIYIRRDGSPVLLDFGAARRVATDRELTTIISPGFAPFEQYHTQGNQGPWTDLYSLAAVMYWMISGEKPIESAARLKHDKMKPAVEIDRHNLFGRSLLEAIDWAMRPEESQRPQSVAEFRRRLQDSVGSDATVTLDTQNQPTIRVPNALAGNTRLGPSGPSDSRRNMVCTILFLDIVAYSTKSVDEQFTMKSEFNQLIAGKLAHIPDSSRVTLDTGDGAAICFMGDPEDVLHAAIDIQRSLTEGKRMQLRIGLHIGPIRLLTDLNGRDNVIGDGINVAQRVMSFADINQIVVSRSYYDVVACLSDNGAARFTHLGEHRDKHDRAHDIYAIVAEHGTDAEPVRTVQLNPPEEPLPTHIDGATLTALTRELARLIGPLAPVLVRKAATRATSAREMRELLGQSLADPLQRQAFLASSASVATTRSGNAVGVANTGGQRTPDPQVSAPPPAVRTAGSDSTTPSLRPWLDEATSKQLEKQLTLAIGPVARIVMKNEIRKASDLDTLCKALAAQIDNAEARAAFLKNIGRL